MIIPLDYFISNNRKSFLSICVNNLSKTLPGLDLNYAFIISSTILGHYISSSHPNSGFFEDVAGVRTNFYVLANAPPRSYKSACPIVLFNNLGIKTLSLRSSVEGIARVISERNEAIIFADEFQDALRSKRKGGYTGDIIDLLKRGYYGAGMVFARRKKECEIEIKPGYVLSLIATTTPDDIIVVADMLDSATLRRFLPISPESKVPFIPFKSEDIIEWSLAKAYLKAVDKITWKFQLTKEAKSFLNNDVYSILKKVSAETGINLNDTWLLNVGEYVLKLAAVVAVDYLLELGFDKIDKEFISNPEYLGDIIAQNIVEGVEEADVTTVQKTQSQPITYIDNIDNVESKITDILLSISESILSKAVEGCRKLISTVNYDSDLDKITVYLNESLVKLSASYVFYLYGKAAKGIEEILGVDPKWSRIYMKLKSLAEKNENKVSLRDLSRYLRMKYTELKDYLLAMYTAGIIDIHFSSERKDVDPFLLGSTIIEVKE